MVHALALCLLSLLPPIPQQPTPPPAAAQAPARGLHVLRTFAVGGEGAWDYVTIDSEARRLYVPRSTRVLVLDADTGKQVGEIGDTAGVHGVALAPEFGRGFTSNGRANTCTVFDLKSGKTLQTVATGRNPDALVYEPVTKCVFLGDGSSKEVTVISADTLKVEATIAVGGKPEALAVDGHGKVFVNIEDTSEVLRIDARQHTVEQRMALAPGEEPTGLAIDAEHHTLFATCHNEFMVVLDGGTGKVLATPAIGKRTDGAAFDAKSGRAFSANGDGTLTVVDTRGDKPFTVVENVPTLPGARTLAFDPKTEQIYLPTAQYEPAPADASSGGRRRPAMKPDSFQIVVVGR
ncbi:MAG TPA: YncE family protein [Planctomycetota bacterium]|nr:YncE family protein [Planctomycetota bacterium]